MKKYCGIFLLMIVTAQSLSAQENQPKIKYAWLDFQMAQHFGFYQWGNEAYINDGLPKNMLTEFRGAFNLHLVRPYIGAFVDMGFGIMPAPKMRSLKLDKMPPPRQGTQYYLREMISESENNGASGHFKMTHGLFGRIPASENLIIMPYFGVGFLTMPQ
jgi:hypothetical protein